MVRESKHHNSALCHVSATLVTRIVARGRSGRTYEIRDVDGTLLTVVEGHRIVAERYQVREELREQRSSPESDGGHAKLPIGGHENSPRTVN